ncbi:MAG TPA: AzlC family ABC transporter permease [Treponemataceae bacterium]|nr:AzlC family ABC transporter permease [Treponemataceae bacterium]
MKQNKITQYILLHAFKVSIPVFFGYIAIGIPFGLMLTSEGYPWWLAPLMSIVMYAGAGQYVAVGLFASGASIGAALLTMIMVNIRHIVYGLSLIEPLKAYKQWKLPIIFLLTDETYAVLTSVSEPPNTNRGLFFTLIALFHYSYWILGSIIGAVAGSFIPISFEGVDFALTSLFIVLLLDQLKKTKSALAPSIGFVVSLLSLFILGPSRMLLSAIAFGIALIILLQKPILKAKEKKDTQEFKGEHNG